MLADSYGAVLDWARKIPKSTMNRLCEPTLCTKMAIKHVSGRSEGVSAPLLISAGLEITFMGVRGPKTAYFTEFQFQLGWTFPKWGHSEGNIGVPPR